MSSLSDAPRPRRLAPADLPAILALQQAVLADLPAGFVRVRSAAEWAGFLDGTRGVVYGIAGAGALSAAALMMLPSAEAPGEPLEDEIAKRGVVFSRGLRARISERDWSRATGFLGNAMVRPEARRRGHQRALIAARLAHAAAAGMRWIFSGVHLHNGTSWRNLLAQGLAIAALRADPRHPLLGLIRGIDPLAVATDAGDRRRFAAHETSQHEAALVEGYLGVGTTPAGSVVYERLLPARVAEVPSARKYLSETG
jgi:hypothetical protein